MDVNGWIEFLIQWFIKFKVTILGYNVVPQFASQVNYP